MAKSTSILDLIYALRETDRSEGFFRPIVETKDLTWHFEICEFDKLGLLVNHIEIKAHKASPLSLEKQSELLKNQITYLERIHTARIRPHKRGAAPAEPRPPTAWEYGHLL